MNDILPNSEELTQLPNTIRNSELWGRLLMNPYISPRERNYFNGQFNRFNRNQNQNQNQNNRESFESQNPYMRPDYTNL